MKTNKKSNEQVICRPCKEQDNWELQDPNGNVQTKHYKTKAECMKAGRKMAEEYSCDLVIEDLKDAYDKINETAKATVEAGANKALLARVESSLKDKNN